MSPIWGALNKTLAMFMNDCNEALKRHRYADTETGRNMQQCQSALLK